ncbi:RNA recognition motif domain-containing protein [Ditylenchus destructor]|uniref:RNA recognition motif domain-containing protein n=1 Tax=Ditylenchus destructor TaxID=166010 RepID=A0AAD4R2T7_9BILA|nr:RNA recognition motif domain-containing protein [Ditylenchus destructor]
MMDHVRHRYPFMNAAMKHDDNHCKIFIGGLAPTTTDEMLLNLYSQFGVVRDCVVMRDKTTDRPRGFGFVTLSSKEEVDRAMDARPHVIDRRTVDPKRATPRHEESIVTTILFVSKLHPELEKEDLEDYFNQYGNVLKIDIPLDKFKNEKRGFAFVTFDDYDAVDKCVLEQSHAIRNYPCYVRKDNKDMQQKVTYNSMKRTVPWNESYGMPMKRGDRYASGKHGSMPQWPPTYGGYGSPSQNRPMPSYAYAGFGTAVLPNTMPQSWYQGGQFSHHSSSVLATGMSSSAGNMVPWFAYTASTATSMNHADIPAAVITWQSNGGS